MRRQGSRRKMWLDITKKRTQISVAGLFNLIRRLNGKHWWLKCTFVNHNDSLAGQRIDDDEYRKGRRRYNTHHTLIHYFNILQDTAIQRISASPHTNYHRLYFMNYFFSFFFVASAGVWMTLNDFVSTFDALTAKSCSIFLLIALVRS